MQHRPLIGFTPDCEYPKPDDQGQFQPGTFARTPYYALRCNYIDIITDTGGIGLMLPYLTDAVDYFADSLDGLILTGGGFDIDPRLFGEKDIHPTVILKPERTEFERQLTIKMLERKKPILGICGGMQLLNVVFGGTLIQDIPSFLSETLGHKQKPPFDSPCHDIHLEEGSKLMMWSGGRHVIQVNSSHHQAIKDVADVFRVTARAPDGIIEAIEHKDYPTFCLGVQWHPEFLSESSVDRKIYASFIQACKREK